MQRQNAGGKGVFIDRYSSEKTGLLREAFPLIYLLCRKRRGPKTMNLTLDLAPERIERLQRMSRRTGKPLETVLDELIDTLPEEAMEEREIPTFAE